MNEITIMAGTNKNGERENYESISFQRGEMIAIVGNTGAGKSRLIKDMEQLADGTTVTKRKVKIDGKSGMKSDELIAHLSQNMRFVLDVTVEEFLILHGKCRNKMIDCNRVLEIANTITSEEVRLEDSLNELSGGQTRAVMIADLSYICDSPIVLIDEIENAGIDKEKALELLIGQNKLVFVVTHDVHTALMAKKRIILSCGGIEKIVERSEKEEELYNKISEEYKYKKWLQQQLKEGDYLQ